MPRSPGPPFPAPPPQKVFFLFELGVFLKKTTFLKNFNAKNIKKCFRLNRILHTHNGILMSENVRFRLNRVREIRICNRIKKLLCNLCAIAIKNIREKLTRKSNKECRFSHLAEQVKCIIISLSSSIQFVKVLRKSSAHSIIIYPEPIRA